MIEDDPDCWELVKLNLLRLSARIQFELHWVTTLSAGLEFLSKSQVDVIVVDLGLPDRDGPTTVKQLAPVAINTPFLSLSAETRDSKLWEVMSHGAEDHIVKGELTPDSLTVAIVNAIARHLERTTELAEPGRLLVQAMPK